MLQQRFDFFFLLQLLSNDYEIISDSKAPTKIECCIYNKNYGELISTGPGTFTVSQLLIRKDRTALNFAKDRTLSLISLVIFWKFSNGFSVRPVKPQELGVDDERAWEEEEDPPIYTKTLYLAGLLLLLVLSRCQPQAPVVKPGKHQIERQHSHMKR